MTWEDYIKERARKLASSRTRAEFDETLSRIDDDLSTRTTPADFWPKLYEAYRGSPKPLLKESTAAAALNALLNAADQVLQQRAKVKR